MLWLSILEGLYIMYMFIFFKTKYSLEINRDIVKKLGLSKMFSHPTKKSEIPKSQICLFGKYGSVFIFFYLILREFVSLPKNTNLFVFFIIMLLCMMNYNAVVYMLPVIVVELYMANRNKLKNLFW
jgi:hypothetical protein